MLVNFKIVDLLNNIAGELYFNYPNKYKEEPLNRRDFIYL